MFWLLLVMALVVSIVLAILVGGVATPRRHTASRSIVLNAAPERVWSLIRDVTNYPDWRESIQNVRVLDSGDAQTAWTEVGLQKSVSYVAEADEPPRRFVARIADEDLGYAGEWEYVVTAAGDGSRLSITERGQVGNIVLRFFQTHLFGHTRTIDAYLRDVASAVGERSQPEDAVL